MTTGRLLIGATPLGRPSDASARLVKALASADVIAAEDTRRLRTLAQALDVKPAGKVVSLFDQNEATRVPSLVEEIQAGATVLLVSDAGMPLISDPGYRLVAACIEAGAPVSTRRACPGSRHWPPSRARACSSSHRGGWRAA
jgi:16S rRNA (cytidine1402-2'-O)-methyltransferase